MKIIFLLFQLLSLTAISQTQKINLSSSNPQPRVGEEFELSINLKSLSNKIFKSISKKLEFSNQYVNGDYGQIKSKVKATNKGLLELGPLTFTFNGIEFSTNQIICEVIDPLPNISNGVWFRKVITSDSTLSIIIDQRIPSTSQKTMLTDSSYSITQVPEISNYVNFKSTSSIEGLAAESSLQNTNYSSIIQNGKTINFKTFFSVQNFKIINNKIKIVLTKDYFINLPNDIKFENIIIQ